MSARISAIITRTPSTPAMCKRSANDARQKTGHKMFDARQICCRSSSIMSRRYARFFQSLALALCLVAPLAHADTLALPPNLTDLSSEEGQKFFLESGSFTAYFPIADNFVTQKTQAYCGVASIVMVLNALGVPAPTTPEYQPYHTFTQDNLLDDMTDAVLPRAMLARLGMTLDQLRQTPAP